MSLYQRGQIWWIQFTNPNGRRIQRSAGTADRRAAQELHDKVKAESWRIARLGERPRYRWRQAVVRWLEEQSHKKSIEDDRCHLRWLDPYLRDLRLDEVTRDVLDRITREKKATGVSAASVNRMLEVVRAILNRAAKEWGWLDVPPHVRMLKEPQGRVRWLTKEEAARLLEALPLHLEAMARFSLLTGLRQGNVTGLRWSQVDLARKCAWVEADETKANRAIAVPLSDLAMEVVNTQVGKHPEFVFTYEGKPITRCNNHAWRKALARAGIEDFRWHDLRHTWASWHVMAGTPLHVLREMGSWSSMDLVTRYAHLSPRHLADHAGNVTDLLQSA